MKKYKELKFTTRRTIEALVFLAIFFLAFGLLARRMGTPNMLNTMMKTAHDLLLNTCFYLMGITVLTGALGRLLTEFGVVRLLENILRPLMKPLFNLPGVAALGAVLTFLSDNPAIISLAHDKNFSSYFKKYQLISLTNFGTAFGMGLVVIAFMVGKGYGTGAVIGLLGAIVGSIVSTRLMQRAIIKAYPQYKEEEAVGGDKEKISFKSEGGVFIRGLNAILDGGKDGVQLGLAIIPGVIVISTVVVMITFSTGAGGTYTGAAYEGVPLLPWLAGKVNFLFEWLFGFQHPELIAFPITALGAVGAALGLVPTFIAQGFIDNNVIAVFTAMGMCWSGYLSTHSAMLDSLGYRNLVPKAIGAHTIGGLCAGISAHLFYLLFSLVF
ncbi:MAG: nucleoside recognition domain-containing protein [Bacteroides sp.]|nr:nucleoside recognition domain-containing protein [Ruminococcus flavefaciens]MCM1554254.1 nucleoside recognition domain-containing protein [Bacteroides sp.]